MDRLEIVTKIRMYDSYTEDLSDQKEFHCSTIKNGKKFLALIEDDDIRFIPGHYAIAPLAQIERTEQRQTVSAGRVESSLYALCGPALHQGMPLYELIDGAYVTYCARNSDRPSAHHQVRSYWLLRP